MTITVRRVAFQFPESLDDVLPGADLRRESYLATFRPSYDPANLEPNPMIAVVLGMFGTT